MYSAVSEIKPKVLYILFFIVRQKVNLYVIYQMVISVIQGHKTFYNNKQCLEVQLHYMSRETVFEQRCEGSRWQAAENKEYSRRGNRNAKSLR